MKYNAQTKNEIFDTACAIKDLAGAPASHYTYNPEIPSFI